MSEFDYQNDDYQNNQDHDFKSSNNKSFAKSVGTLMSNDHE